MDRIHPTACQDGKTAEEIAYEVSRMRYDAIIRFVRAMSEDVYLSSIADMKRDRPKLAAALADVSKSMCAVEWALDEAWRISKPHMADELSMNPEPLIDTDFGLSQVMVELAEVEREKPSWYKLKPTTVRDIAYFLKTYLPDCTTAPETRQNTVMPEVEVDDDAATFRWSHEDRSFAITFTGKHEVIGTGYPFHTVWKYNIWDRDHIIESLNDPITRSIIYREDHDEEAEAHDDD